VSKIEVASVLIAAARQGVYSFIWPWV